MEQYNIWAEEQLYMYIDSAVKIDIKYFILFNSLARTTVPCHVFYAIKFMRLSFSETIELFCK